MLASASTIINEIIHGSLNTVFNVLKILIPLMIVIEILRVYKIMEKLAEKLEGITKVLGMSPPAILPLIVATVMGVTYGAGTLMEMNKVNPIPRKDFILIGIFFFICHGIIETTAIWSVAGANILVISAGRLFIAIIITIIASRLPIFNKNTHYQDQEQ
ncbi:MAG: nucleoside recognition domain-containing protein [Eubacteriales bacterium]|nr:nucleoside recognition domain-containing protein [Eubacteriales bacterium]MDD4582749.1 nucleoside recognition domain-containing protein [Eubacteriales bacterium]